MIRKLLLLSSIILSAFLASAQDRTCASHEVHLKNMLDPSYVEKQAQIEKDVERYKKMGSISRTTGRRTIPVYVHVLWNTNNPQENISNAQIQSQIDVLTQDFTATNSDLGNTPSEFAPFIANYDIDFTIAGITRTESSKTSWGTNDAMKKSSQGGVDPITPDTHLNMWICNIGGGILGYAQFPGGSPATDGVVFSPQYCGSSDYDDGSFFLDAPFDKGRTATHEVGHYLNLRHIWGDGRCKQDDYVDDTPAAGGANYGCPSYPTKSCRRENSFSSDMFMNYMDYVDDACMFMFTEGQKTRTAAIFEPGGVRENLGTVSGGTSCNLSAPGNLSSSNISDTGFTLSWNSVSGAVSYDVTIDGSVTTVSGTSYTASGLSAGTTYNTSVKGNCDSGSGTSASLNVTTTGGSSSSCFVSDVTLSLNLGKKGSGVSWSLTDGGGATVASGSGYSNNQSVTETFALGNGDFTFTITGTKGPSGSYSLTDGSGAEIASAGNVDTSGASVDFCIDGGSSNRTINPLGLDTQEIISMYPNPTSGSLNVEIAKEAKITIYNMIGKVVYSQNVSAGKVTINVAGLNSGLYIMKVGNQTKRFIKK